MKDHKKLQIWREAHLLTKQIYQDILPKMPADERFALTSQLRRSTYSIPLNIVEGCGKNTNKDFAHYLDNALGSAHEVEYTCYLIYDIGYVTKQEYDLMNVNINKVKAMIITFIKYIRNNE